MRPSGRETGEMRAISIETDVTRHAEGSCLIKCGDTHVLCTASIDERVPAWMKNSGLGWVTAEYGMLPRATHTRGRREAKNGQSGRTQEIQRLIGRSLRAVADLEALGERTITVDCDVIQADGGTRTASISGAWVALAEAIQGLLNAGELKHNPINCQVAAISVGVYRGEAVLDLDYAEDSEADTDMNIVMNDQGGFVEIQGTAEADAFSAEQLSQMLNLAQDGIQRILTLQTDA